MAALRALFSKRLRKCACDCRLGKSIGASQRHGLDLVGSPHKLRQPGESKTASGEAPRHNREPGTLPNHCCQASPQEATRFNHLPGNEPWDAECEFPHSCDQRQGESRVSGDAEKVAHEKITALLHAQTSGNRKSSLASRQHHAMQDQRVNECRVKIERIKRNPNFAGATDQRNSRPHATHPECMPPGVKHANGPIERLAALHQRMPLRRIRQARYDASEKTEHSQPLHEVETRNTENTDERSDQSWTNEIFLSSYIDKQRQPEHGE